MTRAQSPRAWFTSREEHFNIAAPTQFNLSLTGSTNTKLRIANLRNSSERVDTGTLATGNMNLLASAARCPGNPRWEGFETPQEDPDHPPGNWNPTLKGKLIFQSAASAGMKPPPTVSPRARTFRHAQWPGGFHVPCGVLAASPFSSSRCSRFAKAACGLRFRAYPAREPRYKRKPRVAGSLSRPGD